MNGEIINKIRLLASLIRLPNLIFLAYLQFSFYLLYISEHSHTSLDMVSYLLGILIPTICIMAFGNVINDYKDYESDRVNNKRPFGLKLIQLDQLKRATYLFLSITLLAIIVSYIVLQSSNLVVTFVLVEAILTLYSLLLKKIAFIGNITVASLAVIGVLLPYLYLIYTEFGGLLDSETSTFLAFFFGLIFTTSLTREIIKDIEDIDGDTAADYRTLPVLIGIQQSKNLFVLLSLINLLLINYWMYISQTTLALVIFIFAVVPLIVFFLLYYRKVQMSVLSNYLKFQMLIASLILISYKFL